MKKNKNGGEMKSEYKKEDLGHGIRGKHFDAYNESHNVVLLDPEVAKFFPTENSVNEALLSIIKIAKNSVDLTNRSS
ncbi:MAG: hypothetical protein MAG581_02018 [Deltaproteobacteria bacterium]|jgi:hypothetical protein|nr:hypothetical protein [Deltaproteobacteria bacterium]